VFQAKLKNVIDPPWTNVAAIKLGAVPRGLGTPDLYVLIEENGTPKLRVDLYAGSDQCYHFNEVAVWQKVVVIGFGHNVYCVEPETRDAAVHQLGSYFGKLYSGEHYLLVASAERLYRLNREGSLQWTTQPLGIDGVVVNSVENGIVEGEGEWDPPGGWKTYRVHLVSGLPV
jgi:hypothetical protein